jgi:hypothetical protein
MKMKTADSIEELKAANPLQPKKKDGRAGNGRHPRSRANLKPYKKGESGNPSGLPGYDVSAFICRRIIEDNQEQIYQGMGNAVVKGNAYAFSVVSDRGYGKLTEKREISVEVSVNSKLLEARKRLLEKRNGNSDTTSTIN